MSPAPALGLETVFGTGVESTYGSPVVVDRWYEFTSESLGHGHTPLQSSGIRPGGSAQARRAAKRKITQRWGEGDVTMEVATRGMGRWFAMMLGGAPTIAAVGATTAFLQTHEMGSLAGKSLTIQKVLRDNAGTVVSPFTLHGCKVTSWELAAAIGDYLKLTCSINAEEVDTSTAPAAHAYSDADAFDYSEGTLRVDGAVVASVTGASIAGDNALRTDFFPMGTNGLKGEPHVNDFRPITGQLSAEFQSAATFYDRFAGDVSAELVMEFLGAVIEGAERERLTITVPDIRFTGGSPSVGGAGVVMHDAPFEAQWNGVDPTISLEYVSADTAV